MRRTERRFTPRARPSGSAGDSVVLPPALERSVARGHPWIYRDHVPSKFHAPTGTLLRVVAGRAVAYGLWDESSAIALRLLRTRERPNREFVRARLKQAYELRAPLRSQAITGYRFLNGEGDGLPGMVLDRYDQWMVLLTSSPAVESLVPWVLGTINEVEPCRGVLWRHPGTGSKPAADLELLTGEMPPSSLVIRDRELRFYADLGSGQKSGLYFDQRDNRRAIEPYCREARVLDLFSYTGGFAVAATRFGARSTTCVDQAEAALDRARDNFRLNALDTNGHEFIRADCFEWLKHRAADGSRFDLVICDPPSLTRNRLGLDRALAAYAKLNAMAMTQVRDGGYLAAASCTAQVSPTDFRRTLGEAARRAGCRFQVVAETGHAIDHPIDAAHPEGRYLKFVIGRVLRGS